MLCKSDDHCLYQADKSLASGRQGTYIICCGAQKFGSMYCELMSVLLCLQILVPQALLLNSSLVATNNK
jgi:hypothetical protein